MGERMGRIGRIRTDFSCHSVGNLLVGNLPVGNLPVGNLSFRRKRAKRQNSYGMTRKIRSYPPNPPHPFSHRITMLPKQFIHHYLKIIFPLRKKAA
jgi:hypothetical protein